MINVLINGANGRMGKKVFECATLSQRVNAVCGVDVKADYSNPNYPIFPSFSDVVERIDVVIDFSSPSCLDNILEFCKKNSCGAILCTTGYSDSDIEKIKKASEDIAIFRSGNMSLGINLLINLVKKATSTLYGFDVEIIEKHHNQKVDAPSGTALMLAEAVKEVDGEKFFNYGREGLCGKRDKNEIGIHAVRGGTIVGEHDVIFAGNNETITLSHQASDRSVFANGAITASVYIASKKQGLYDMSDVIEQR